MVVDVHKSGNGYKNPRAVENAMNWTGMLLQTCGVK